MGLKVMSVKEFAVSHVIVVGGLVLVTVGLSLQVVGLTIAGIWIFAVGMCVGLGFAFKKLTAK